MSGRESGEAEVVVEPLNLRSSAQDPSHVAETKEELTFWTVNRQGQEEKEIAREALGRGIFIKGFKKVAENGDTIFNFEELITII